MNLFSLENTIFIFAFRQPFHEPDGVRICPINSNEHDAKHGVRSGPGQPLAPEHRDKPGASSYQLGHSKKIAR
jgi:hypothetical protein